MSAPANVIMRRGSGPIQMQGSGKEVEEFFKDRDPRTPITPEDLEEFNRQFNEKLQKDRRKEEEWDYPYREENAILAKGFNKGGQATRGAEYDALFQAAGEKYGVEPGILRAIASVESNFNPQAVGPKTRSGRAQGMMQFIPATAKAYGLEDPFNPEQSVDAAARLMRDLQKQFGGDVGKALEAYNGGPRLVGKSKQTAKYREMVLARAGRGVPEPIVEPAESFIGAKSVPKELKQGEMYGEAPKTAPQAPSAPRQMTMGTIESMPPSYRTAFALQYLAETEPDEDPEVKANDLMSRLEQLESDDAAAGPSLLASFFSEQAKESVSPIQTIQSKKNPRRQQQKRALPSMQVVQGFAQGGDVSEQMTVGTLPEDAQDYRRVLEGLKKSLGDIRRGIQYSPADLVGAPVDIANMVLQPFGLGSEKPFMGSEYLIDKGVKAGIYEPPSGTATETLARLGAGIVAPTFGARTAGRGIAAFEESLKGPPEGAIKPRGGVFDPGTTTEVPQLSMTKMAAKMRDRDGLGRPMTDEHRKQVEDFVNTKYAKYIKNDFGTEKDPLRQAFLAGRIYPPAAPGIESNLYSTVADYVKAEKGDSLKDYRKGQADIYYDAATNINPVMLIREKDFPLEVIDKLENDPKTYSSLKVLVGKRLGELGLPKPIVDDYYKTIDGADFNTYENLNNQAAISPEIIDISNRYADALAANVTKMSAEGATGLFKGPLKNPTMKVLGEDEYNALDETLKRSVNKELVFDMSEPTYLSELNPDRLVDTLSVVPPNKLANMDFAKAFEEGNKILSPVRNFEKGVGDVLANRAVPKEFLFTFTSPVAKSEKGQWVHLDNARVNTVEGHLMKHSIGGYADSTRPYGLSGNATGKEAFDSGQVEVFSLRDDKGIPMVTLEYGTTYGSGNPKYVEQIQGKFNSAPTEYIKDVLRLMKEKNLSFSPNRRLTSSINEHAVNRAGKPLEYTDKDTGKTVIAHDVVDWTALKKAYDADPDNFQVIKVAKPENTRDVLYKHTIYTTPERLNAANSETGPGGFVQLKAQGGLVSKPLYDRA